MAHELRHTQQPLGETTPEQDAVNEREADDAAAKTYGGKTFSNALEKGSKNSKNLFPLDPKQQEFKKMTEGFKEAYPERSSGTANDNQFVEQITAKMSPEEKDKWLQQQVQQVEADMRNRGTLPTSGPKKIGDVAFAKNPDEITDVSGADITINERQSRQLTLREMKSVLAEAVAFTQQKDPDSDTAVKEAMHDAAQTYGGQTYINAMNEMYRSNEPDPHDRLTIRQQRALKNYPENSIKEPAATSGKATTPRPI